MLCYEGAPLNSETVIVHQEDKLKQLIEQINNLPPDEKAQLLSSLLGKEAGLSVIFGNGGSHVMTADVVIQISGADASMIEKITEAIASRIEKRS